MRFNDCLGEFRDCLDENTDRLGEFRDCLEDLKESKGDCLIKNPWIEEFNDAIEMDLASSKADSETKSKPEMVPVLATKD